MADHVPHVVHQAYRDGVHIRRRELDRRAGEQRNEGMQEGRTENVPELRCKDRGPPEGCFIRIAPCHGRVAGEHAVTAEAYVARRYARVFLPTDAQREEPRNTRAVHGPEEHAYQCHYYYEPHCVRPSSQEDHDNHAHGHRAENQEHAVLCYRVRESRTTICDKGEDYQHEGWH